MKDRTERNVKLLEENLAFAQKRLERNLPIITGQAVGEITNTRIYGVYEDALATAGYARAINKPEAEVRELLVTATRAAVQLFRSSEVTFSKITHLPSGDKESFPDTSMYNPWTYVRAVYATLAAGQSAELAYLASLKREAYHSEQFSVSPVFDDYSHALNLAVARDAKGALAELNSILSESGDSEEADDFYWLSQAEALKRLLEKDTGGAQRALAEVSEAIKDYYSDPQLRNNPERFLELPMLGLTAFGTRLGVMDGEV